ncbi:uncharacterized protein LOC113277990 [Papaver somniferum]|uniref:uncharacterized protein LOC113277990 n=1 Tax=Papaver somniferum TaxID=3469 RepID=UPI000E6FA948|nr:uncharacterized protein LOC113277990 [Papaver somniferum]
MGLNLDLDKMEKDASKVAKMPRKNTQDYLVKLFDEFCDGHGIPRAALDLEVFTDDDQQDDKKATSDDGDDGSDGGGDEEKIEGDASKGDSAPTSFVGQPSNPLVQSQVANVEAYVAATSAGPGE